MPTIDRRQREFAAREQLFLAKARELIAGEGLLNLQMARLAEACEYATGTLYQHFASKEDVLVALMTEGARFRGEMFARVARWQASTRDRMFGIGYTDTLFVRRFPEHFRLEQYASTEVIWERTSHTRRQAMFANCRPNAELIHDIVRQATAADELDLRGQTVEELTLGFWGLSAGVNKIAHATDLLEHFFVGDPYAALMRHHQHLLNGVGWKPLMQPVTDTAVHAVCDRLQQEVFHDLV